MRMIMTPRQQIATAMLAVLIVASVMSMPRTLDVPREKPQVTRSAELSIAQPTAARENAPEQVRDLTYN